MINQPTQIHKTVISYAYKMNEGLPQNGTLLAYDIESTVYSLQSSIKQFPKIEVQIVCNREKLETAS